MLFTWLKKLTAASAAPAETPSAESSPGQVSPEQVADFDSELQRLAGGCQRLADDCARVVESQKHRHTQWLNEVVRRQN